MTPENMVLTARIISISVLLIIVGLMIWNIARFQEYKIEVDNRMIEVYADMCERVCPILDNYNLTPTGINVTHNESAFKHLRDIIFKSEGRA